ncbi:DUF551 domain-containing protein [Klebsiella aerogenes]|nr:DUF551 domain-containing protein [Klebsiella aerogenes]
MTKSTITDERITSVIERLEHFASNLKWTDVRGAQDLLTAADGLRELQERRKAAMDSEPVAWRYRTTDINGKPNPHWSFSEEASLLGLYQPLYAHPAQPAPGSDSEPVAEVLSSRPGNDTSTIDRALPFGTQLYRHAQPAPVVMDDEKLRALFDAWFASDCSFDQSPEASEADNIAWRESYWYVWQRCRAAMLQAEPVTTANKLGNSPVIPDTWIPVSERMPEERETVVLVADERGIVWCAEIQDGEIYPDEFPGTRGFGCSEATHWMPLPAAPQEVKGE